MAAVYAALADRVVVHAERTVHERLVGETLECLAATPDGEHVFAGTVDNGLRASHDGGHTWETAGFADDPSVDRVTAVTVSPHAARTVWVGTEPSAVYRSTDAGASWAETTPLTELPRSDRWSFPPRPDTHHVRWIALAPNDPDTLYVAVEAGGLLRSTDGGDTWEDHTQAARRDTHTLATHPDAPDRVYAAAGDGYAESRDRGATWRYPQAGLDHRYTWSVAVDPGDPDRVLLSAAAGAHTAHAIGRAETYIYRREGPDDDANWERAMDGLGAAEGLARAVLATDGTPGRVWAVSNRGLFRSPDAGGAWERVADHESITTGRLARGLVVV
jgi:photosystem II stability/assembly factor-like uncharacterized protein